MSETAEAAVLTERRGRTLLITLNRPEARNAVNDGIARGLEAAIDELEGDDELWTGVLTGNGPVFCAGADLKMVASGGMGMLTERGGFGGYVQRERTKPVIAAVQGDALAGGFEIAIASDLIVAAEGVRFGIPEVKRSLLAVAGALANLPMLVGEKLALEMAMTGEPSPVERFVPLGLVAKVVPAADVVDAACALAETINANAPLAVRGSRNSIVKGRDLPESERWSLALAEVVDVYRSEDFQEGPRAFIEKRPPQWKGR